jgi:uncharacterized membrane protein YfcA
MEILGYLCAALVGISLGILGSGGSILTVPIMVYLMHISPVDATGLSLFIVGITSATGGITYVRRKLVDLKTASVFALPSIISVFLTRKFLLPAIPDPVYTGPGFMLSKNLLILLLFALLMAGVGYNMIRNSNAREADLSEVQSFKFFWLLIIGLISGVLTGLLGVGGGFIIIPSLVLFGRIPLRMSVGTSLLIIAVNSFSGFIEEMLTKHAEINYSFLLTFALFSVAGIFLGFSISLKLRPSQLKRIFGWFIMIMGLCIFLKEIIPGMYSR